VDEEASQSAYAGSLDNYISLCWAEVSLNSNTSQVEHHVPGRSHGQFVSTRFGRSIGHKRIPKVAAASARCSTLDWSAGAAG
jgi:hypothetical protein